MSGLGFVQNNTQSHSKPQNKNKISVTTNEVNIVQVSESKANSTINVPVHTLFRWNVSMFLFHTALLVTTLTVGNLDLHVPVYSTSITFVETNSTPAFLLVPTYTEIGTWPLTYIVASFFLCSALAHFGNAFLWKSFYERDLKRCRVTTRWIEYFFSASIMILIISYNAGIREYTLLIAQGTLVAVTMLFGYITEKFAVPYDTDNWCLTFNERIRYHFMGYIPQIVAWLIIVVNFFDDDMSSEPPWFVYLIIFAELVLFFSFGIVQLVQQYSSPKNYYKGEIAYQALSLISKGFLGLIILSQVLILGSFEEIFA